MICVEHFNRITQTARPLLIKYLLYYNIVMYFLRNLNVITK